MTQTQTGKAFEYAILQEFNEKLNNITNVKIVQNDALATAKKYFDQFDKQAQGRYLLTASFAVNFLMDIEPRLKHDIGKKDILQLEILTDYQGQLGDVRDVVAIRKLQAWEIGVSAKNNHKAIKHSRLSNKIDFGEKWLGIQCSQMYFDEIGLIFDPLKAIKNNSNSTQKWDTLNNKEDNIYIPILKAFKQQTLDLASQPNTCFVIRRVCIISSSFKGFILFCIQLLPPFIYQIANQLPNHCFMSVYASIQEWILLLEDHTTKPKKQAKRQDKPCIFFSFWTPELL
jgi:hypothetical protein